MRVIKTITSLSLVCIKYDPVDLLLYVLGKQVGSRTQRSDTGEGLDLRPLSLESSTPPLGSRVLFLNKLQKVY